jgi:hypothetical protein
MIVLATVARKCNRDIVPVQRLELDFSGEK